jgi:CRISPR system Cascade subunit CasA
MSYSLLSEPWIPVRQGGQSKRVGLLELFQSWHALQDVCAANPPRQIALYRFLIAIVHAALEGPATPQEYKELWVDKQLGKRICTYLNHWAERFDLLHPDRPFLQDISIAGTIGQTRIGKAVYQDANTPIIWFKPNDTPWLALPDATQELLRMQSLELGGRKSDAITAGPGRWTQGRHVFPVGSSLRETFLLNLTSYEATDADRPVWEQDKPYGTGERHPSGYLEWLTYCERRILLTVKGDKVTHLRLASGWKPPAGSGSTHDQHQAFRYLSKEKVWLPFLFNPQRQLWDDSEAILHTIENSNYRPKIFDWLSNNRKLKNPQPVRVLGFAHAGGTNTAKAVHWTDDVLAVPELILEDTDVWEWVEGAITLARRFGQVFTGKTFQYASSPLSRGERDTITAQLSSLQAALYSYIGQQFPGLLIDLVDVATAQTRLEQWQAQLKTYSEELISLLVTALPDYRSKAISEQMFKTAIYKTMHKSEQEKESEQESTA